MNKPVIIFGAQGIAIDALEIFQSNNITVYGFLDDDQSLQGTEINDIPVLGDTEDQGYLKLIGQKCKVFIATDESNVRKELVKFAVDKCKVMPTNAVHSQAIISTSSSIGHGNFINARAILGANVEIGQYCIVHTGVILESGVKVADFSQIGAGSIINAGVTIEEDVFIGSGVNIVGGVTISKGARIGAGSVVIQSVKKGETVFGNPAIAVKK